MPSPSINSRAKGQRFERDICKALGEWWGCSFKRTPLSGGWSKDALVGDVVPVTEGAFPWLFSVECKDQQGWGIDEFFRNDKSKLNDFLGQCIWDASRKKLVPLLIAKSKNVKPLCFTPLSISSYGCIYHSGLMIYVVRLTDLTSISPKVINGYCNRYLEVAYGVDKKPQAGCVSGVQADTG
jgi:Holliday junction resolvase